MGVAVMVGMVIRTRRMRVAVFVSDAALVVMLMHLDTILRADHCSGQA